VGIDAYAITTGVSAFFAGLAVGSILFGRMTDRVKRPLLLYALIEAATALSATSAKVVLANSASSQSQRGS
jgi:MFS family permease